MYMYLHDICSIRLHMTYLAVLVHVPKQKSIILGELTVDFVESEPRKQLPKIHKDLLGCF